MGNGIAWIWPSILVPIGVFFLANVWLSATIASDALEVKHNKQNQ
jgi:hypothetical protein